MKLSTHKVLLFVFVFSIVLLNVNGFVFLSNLRDAVLSAESLVGDIFKNVVQVVQQFRFFDIFDAAVEEHCVFRCPNGKSYYMFMLLHGNLILINQTIIKPSQHP